MIEGKTKSGFAYKVDSELLDDMEFIELAAGVGTSRLALPELVEYVLGKDQKKALYEHVRENGRVKASRIDAEVTEIFDALAQQEETKN